MTTKVKVHALKPDGMRRAGQHWPAETVEREVDDTTLAAIENEPMLDVCRWHNGRYVRSSRAHPKPEKVEGTLADALAAKNEESIRLRQVNADLKDRLDRVQEDLRVAREEIELRGQRVIELEALIEAGTKPASKGKG